MKKQMVNSALVFLTALALCPRPASAQNPTPDDDPPAAQGTSGTSGPQGVQRATNAAQEFVRKFHIGGFFGTGLDPELIEFGGHGMWGPYFKNSLDFRPGVDVGIGELSTLLAANFDLLYRFPQAERPRWTPFVGGGFNYTMMHKSFATEEELGDDVNPTTKTTTTTSSTGTTVQTTTAEHFDFSKTKWEGGANVIVGARTRRGVFIEMRASVFGAQIVKVVTGFDF